jgi:DNA-binding CsgD family transcriptional regulator
MRWIRLEAITDGKANYNSVEEYQKATNYRRYKNNSIYDTTENAEQIAHNREYIETQSKLLAVLLERRERQRSITEDDIEKALKVIDDFGLYIHRNKFPNDINTMAELEKWQRAMINEALENPRTYSFFGRKKKECPPKLYTVEQFTPYYTRLTKAKFCQAEKEKIAAELFVSVSTVNRLIRETRYGKTQWVFNEDKIKKQPKIRIEDFLPFYERFILKQIKAKEIMQILHITHPTFKKYTRQIELRFTVL